MSDMIEKRTPEQIGAEIRMYMDVGRRVTLLCGIEIGRRLVEAKELLPHGEWLPWLQRETEFSERSAQNYMKVFKEYGAAQLGLFGPETNTQTFADLPISKALALISVPESDRIEFAEVVDAEHISVRELEEKIRDRERQISALQEDVDGERKRLEESERLRKQSDELLETQDDMLKEAKAQIAELAKLNKELENRPVEVAVETVRDEAAIAAAAKEAKEKAEAAAKRKIADLEKRLNKAEDEAAKAKNEAQIAGESVSEKIAEAQKEADFLRAELAEARKQLKASDADVAKFGVWFTTVQKDFDAMLNVLELVRQRNPETGEKLKAGAATLLKTLLERVGSET